MPGQKKTKYLIGFLIIAGVLTYLLSTSFQSSLQYYVTVSELHQDMARYKDKVLKVAGTAEAISKEGATYQFLVHEGGEILRVSYKGFVPDTFHEGSEVVVTGSLNSDSSFEATEILAKCASKYEAKIQP